MRAESRRAAALLLMAGVAIAALARVLAQSPPLLDLVTDDPPASARAAAAAAESRAVLEAWLGPAPPSSIALAGRLSVPTTWPPAPLTMDVEAAVARAMARAWLQPDSGDRGDRSLVIEGAARYLQAVIVSRLFDRANGRSGHHAESIRLFGGTYTVSFPHLVLDGATAGLGRERGLGGPDVRSAHAFASLARLVGEPRTVAVLRALVEARPADDAAAVRVITDSLGQDVAWLFDAMVADAGINYAIRFVATEPCEPGPCVRTRVTATHAGAVVPGLNLRAEFADGQTASAPWAGGADSHEFLFEAPAPPVRVGLGPAAALLLDDHHLDHAREVGGATNAPIAKWTARWLVWLQDVMVAVSGLV